MILETIKERHREAEIEGHIEREGWEALGLADVSPSFFPYLLYDPG